MISKPCLNSDLYFILKTSGTALLVTSFLQTYFQSLPGNQENPSPSASRHINNSLSVYLLLDSELYIDKPKEFNNERMKVQVKRAFKSYFLSPKNNKKADRLHEIFFNLQYKCAKVPISPISKSVPPFSAAPSFMKNISNLRSGSTKW